MRRFQGIGDTLEDDVERIHQVSEQIESRISRMKNKNQQAHIHSKMEAIQSSISVKEQIQASQLLAKRLFKKRNLQLCAIERAKKLKKERDDSQAETLLLVEQMPHMQLRRSHEIAKENMMAESNNI
jgi:ethanolamine ammonia-lyase large subunit